MIVEKLSLQDRKNYSLACCAFDADAAPFIWGSFVLDFEEDDVALGATCAIPILRIPERANYVHTLTISPRSLSLCISDDRGLSALKEAFALLRNVRDLRLFFRESWKHIIPKDLTAIPLVTQLADWMKTVVLVSFTCDGLPPSEVLCLLRTSPFLSSVTVNDSRRRIKIPSSLDATATFSQAPLPQLSMLNTHINWVPILARGRDLDTLFLSPGRFPYNRDAFIDALRDVRTIHTLHLAEMPVEGLVSILGLISDATCPATTLVCATDVFHDKESSPGATVMCIFGLVNSWIGKVRTLVLRSTSGSPEYSPESWVRSSFIRSLQVFSMGSFNGSVDLFVVQFPVMKKDAAVFQELRTATFKRQEDGTWAASLSYVTI